MSDNISSINELLPEVFSIIGVYGSRCEIMDFLKKIFQQPLPKISMKEGIFLLFNPENSCGCLVYVTESRLITKNTPNIALKMPVTILRILSDFCITNICCISELIADKWFYENNGKHNPFISKTHGQGQIDILRKKITEPMFEDLELKSKIRTRKSNDIVILSKSSVVFFGYFEDIYIKETDAEC